MKTSLLSWSMVLVATGLVACGDDTSTGTGGAGGEGTTGAATTGSSSPTTSTGGTPATSTGSSSPTSTASTSSGEQGGGGNGEGGDTTTSASGGGGSGQGGDNGCEDLEFTDIAFDAGAYIGGVDPALGGADQDFGVILFDPIVQEIDLSLTDLATSTQLIFAGEDFVDKVGYTAAYVSNAGTLTVAESGWSFEGVQLLEIDFETGAFIDGGRCFNLADASGDLEEPLIPAEWTCDPAWYGAADGCDCVNCGAYDPDCDDPDGGIFGCEVGQTCSDDGLSCEGVPDAWTCTDAEYNDGTTCDCTCGTGDPDCDGVNPIDGCTAGQTCSSTGVCLDPEALCADLNDNDEDGRIDCDDATSCSVALAPADCTPGATAIGLGCDANTDCTGATGAPICLTEADLGFPGGQCGEWCDLANDGCPNGTECSDFGVARGICVPSCTDDTDCDNAEAVCTVDGICIAGGVPGAWVCSPGFYGTGDGCDCGCGVVDPDCASADEADCEFCIDPSCADDGAGACDLDLLVDDDNAVCE